MTQIKIISNPYKQDIKYEIYKENAQKWVDISLCSKNGRLREENVRKCFLPFNIKEILEIIDKEYYLESRGAINIIFEGTKDEYNEVLSICQEEFFKDKFKVERSKNVLDNGKYILSDTKEIFKDVKIIIKDVMSDEFEIIKNLEKVSDALDDIIPICVFGNYSAGKSTFINALIGREILPSGGNPVTAKAFKIQNSNQSDVARIKFEYCNDIIEIAFEDDNYHFVKGNINESILVELASELNSISIPTINNMVSLVLKFVNEYDNKDKKSMKIGNVIELFINFSKNGILGCSNNKFVIFDTPGSNTATNDGHIEVLKEALDGFSNGIPVWVSQYEAIDTMDNEALCNNILNIDALDQRFTMIVLNKADVSDLPEKNFNDKQIKNIKEFKSVEKMYASGIFFVSSIMGLGAKNDGKLMDKYYRKIYKLQTDSFSDPEDEDYMALYQYNIMPQQIKEAVIKYSANEKNIIYVNSGLHCIETEIEDFASKYSAYNKCQMVYMLLSDVVEKTTEKIEKRVKARKKLRDRYIDDLEDKKKKLIETLREKSEELDKYFFDESYNSVNSYAKTNFTYNYPLDKLNEINEKHTEENSIKYNLNAKQKSYNNALEKMFTNIKENVKTIDALDIKDTINNFKEETIKDFGEVVKSKKELNINKQVASEKVVDEVLNIVIKSYKADMDDAENKINKLAYNYWKNSSQSLKNKLMDIVTLSDALTDYQKESLSKLIFNYENISYDDKASTIFVKPKFLQGRLFGMNLFTFEKLNTNKLSKEYNKAVMVNIETIATDMNRNYYNSYKKWQEDLSELIEQNIIELNPELQVISDSIENETKIINSLEASQQVIKASLAEIENLISFKIVE